MGLRTEVYDCQAADFPVLIVAIQAGGSLLFVISANDCGYNANPNKQKEVAKVRKVTKISELAPGMVLARGVVDFNGKVVLSEGCVITEKTIQRLDAWDIREVCIDCPDNTSTGA